jgi:hypothetical protein
MAKKKKVKADEKGDLKNIPQLDGLAGLSITDEAQQLFWRITREDPNVEESDEISKTKMYTTSYYDLVALSVGISWKKDIEPEKIPSKTKIHGINAPQVKTEHVDIYRTIYLLKKYEELLKEKGGNKESITPNEYIGLLKEFGNNAKVRNLAEELCNGAFYRLKSLIEGVSIPNNNIMEFFLEEDVQ